MSLLKFRTWAVVATLVTLQAPVMFAGKSGPPKRRARIDRQIERIEQSAGTTATVSVIVRPDGTADWASLLKTLRSKGIRVGRQAWRSRAISLKVSPSDLAWLESLPGIESVSIDAPVVSAPLAAQDFLSPADLARAAKKASDLRSQLGLTDADPTGNGIGIAIIDSGIAPVPDLVSRITAFYDFTNGQNAVATAPLDGYGHGTHVAGLAAGDGTLSNGTVRRRGAGCAPDRPARPRQLRRRIDQRRRRRGRIRDGQQGRARHRRHQHVARASAVWPAADDPMVQAVEAASRAGIIVVVSAGNAGINPSTGLVGYGGILVPGNAPSAFTIASAKTQGDGRSDRRPDCQLQLARAGLVLTASRSRTSRCRATTWSRRLRRAASSA